MAVVLPEYLSGIAIQPSEKQFTADNFSEGSKLNACLEETSKRDGKRGSGATDLCHSFVYGNFLLSYKAP